MRVQFYAAHQPGKGHIYRTLALALEMQKTHQVAVFSLGAADEIRQQYIERSEFDGNCSWFVLDYLPEYVQWREHKRVCNIGLTGDKKRDDLFPPAELEICLGIPSILDTYLSWGFCYYPIWPEVLQLRAMKTQRKVFCYPSIWQHMKPVIEAVSQFVEVVQPPQSNGRFDNLMSKCSLVLSTGGVTTLEACAMGKPQVVISHDAANHHSMRYLAARGAFILHRHNERDLANEVAMSVRHLLDDEEQCQKMSICAMNEVDGNGARRIGSLLEEWVK